MAKIIDGRKISEKILKKVRKEIERKKLNLTLGVIFVGKNKASEIFIREKEKAAQKAKVGFKVFHFSEKINQKDLEKEIKKIASKKEINGLLIQLPLPKKFNQQKLLDLIPLKKDVDFLSSQALGNFYTKDLKILPPTVSALEEIFKNYKINFKKKRIVLIGGGKLVGKPIALWLLKNKASFSLVEKSSSDFSFFLKKADILISGVGKGSLIKGEMIKKGAICIDFGVSFKKGKIKGDFDFESVFKKASYLTPTPGGTGPITVACLFKNLLLFNLSNPKI